jgi:ABC-type multidrug transport system ATPase subunit
VSHSKSFAKAASDYISVNLLNRPPSIDVYQIPDVPDANDEELLKDMHRVCDFGESEDILQVAGLKMNFQNKTNCLSPRESRSVLTDLWINIRANECYGFLGPNGSGKTTTINVLTGKIAAQTGYARIGPYSISPHYDTRVRSQVSLCLQFDVFWDQLTVLELLKLFSSIKGQDPNDSSQNYLIEQLLIKSDLGRYKDTKLAHLSGGNRRKLSVLVTALGSPMFVFMDGEIY